MSELPTVKIHHPELLGRWILINQEDFNPDIHTRYEDQRTIPPRGYVVVSKEGLDASNQEFIIGSSAAQQLQGDELSQDDLKTARTNELEALLESDGWQAIAAIAEPLGIEKPSRGWKLAIPLIVEQEFPES